MTKREQEILSILREDPLISQQDLARRLGITRSSVSVHIANLLKKGVILGKGYVIGGGEYVSVFGGANMDIQGFPKKPLIMNDSNPGTVLLSMGGVGRNIAENIARLGLPVKLFTYLGDDFYGEQVRRETARAGVDLSGAEVLAGASTGIYLCILDETGDMKVAVSHMDIYDRMTASYVDRRREILARSSYIVVDTNPPAEVLRHLFKSLPESKFIADTVSVTKSEKLKELLPWLHTVKPNRLEARVLTGVEITGRASMDRAADIFLGKGVKNIFITLGPDGTFYCDEYRRGIMRANRAKVVNATGAGDAFTAGLALGNLRGMAIEEKTRFAMGAALVALRCGDTINPKLNEETVMRAMEESEIVEI